MVLYIFLFKYNLVQIRIHGWYEEIKGSVPTSSVCLGVKRETETQMMKGCISLKRDWSSGGKLTSKRKNQPGWFWEFLQVRPCIYSMCVLSHLENLFGSIVGCWMKWHYAIVCMLWLYDLEAAIVNSCEDLSETLINNFKLFIKGFFYGK